MAIIAIVVNCTINYNMQGRDGKGNIYVWAAGNGGYRDDSCVADGYITSIYTIGVGAANNIGHPARYDEQCSAKMVVTFNDNSYSFSCGASYDDVVRLSHYFSIRILEEILYIILSCDNAQSYDQKT